MKIQISEVKIEIVKPNNGLVGFASLVIDDSIYLSSIAIYKKLNDEGFRILYPTKDKFAIYHPITKEASTLIEEAIFNKLKDVMKKIITHIFKLNAYQNSTLAVQQNLKTGCQRFVFEYQKVFCFLVNFYQFICFYHD